MCSSPACCVWTRLLVLEVTGNNFVDYGLFVKVKTPSLGCLNELTSGVEVSRITQEVKGLGKIDQAHAFSFLSLLRMFPLGQELRASYKSDNLQTNSKAWCELCREGKMMCVLIKHVYKDPRVKGPHYGPIVLTLHEDFPFLCGIGSMMMEAGLCRQREAKIGFPRLIRS